MHPASMRETFFVEIPGSPGMSNFSHPTKAHFVEKG